MSEQPIFRGWVLWRSESRQFVRKSSLSMLVEGLENASIFGKADVGLRWASAHVLGLVDPLRVWVMPEGHLGLLLPTVASAPPPALLGEQALEQVARGLERRAEGAMALSPDKHVTNLQRTHLWGKAEGLRLAVRELRAIAGRGAR